MSIVYKSTKSFGPEFGLSCCFRQHNAKSHCSKLHGYALSVHLEFEAATLDENGWVIDFGSFGPIKSWLKGNFDHKLLVAEDDPSLNGLLSLQGLGVADVLIVPRTGCEAFAMMIYVYVQGWLISIGEGQRVHLGKVEVREHQGNSGMIVVPSFAQLTKAI